MKHVKIEAFNIPDAVFKVIKNIWVEGETFVVGKGSEITETKKLDVTVVISNPEVLPYADSTSTTDDNHIKEYSLNYLWTDYVGEHPYTYGYRLKHPIDQVEKIIKDIIECPQSRQLTMVIRIPEDVDNKEPPCLSLIDFEVSNNKIHMTCYFRSWDAYGALNENIGGLHQFLKGIVEEVNDRSGSNYSTGSMILHSKNCHIYKRCYPFVENMLKNSKDIRREMVTDTYSKKVLKEL